MSQLSPSSPLATPANPFYARIADRLDDIAQKYRLLLILRGAILFHAAVLPLTLAACLLANGFGDGLRSRAVLGGWIIGCLAAVLAWLVRPLLRRPDAARVARLVESRVTGLHDGLTSTLQLAYADDLQSNPWLGAIYEEVAARMDDRPIDAAVRLKHLQPLALRAGGIIVLCAVITLLVPASVSHGFRQMLSPRAFIPIVGRTSIVQVKPGNVTLVAGQPLEISVDSNASSDGACRLIVDSPGVANSSVTLARVAPSVAGAGTSTSLVNFQHRIDHVDLSMRYRVEVGGTQSPWFDVTVVKKINLQQFQLRITPPSYLASKLKEQTIEVKASDAATAPISVPQGSRVDIAAVIDVPVVGGLMQVGDAAPVVMERGMEAGAMGRRFSSSTVAMSDLSISLLLTQSGGQIVAKVPDSPLLVRAIPDAPPTITPISPAASPTFSPVGPVKIIATLRDDLGLKSVRLFLSTDAEPSADESSMKVVDGKEFVGEPVTADYAITLGDSILKPEFRVHGRSIRVRLEAADNRDLRSIDPSLGSQTTLSPVFEIRFRDPEVLARETREDAEKLRAEIQALLELQQSLHAKTLTFKPFDPSLMKQVNVGQTELVTKMRRIVDTFEFDASNKLVQKTLLVLIANPAGEAVELSAAIAVEPVAAEQSKLSSDLQSRQRRIMETLKSLLSLIAKSDGPTTEPSQIPGTDANSKAEEYKNLLEDLKKYQAEQRRVLDQTASLAKKPVDDWDDKDKKLLADLMMSQEKLDAFMQEKVSDISKLAEQDMSNSSLLKELMEVYGEVTMAKNALNKQATMMAVDSQASALELAKSIESNIEKWLATAPDREKWEMNDPPGGLPDIPMAELPAELQDMIGDLMEQQEDLFEQMEDAAVNWADSADKGAGWGTADGPIANMSAKGVTGNVLPNSNSMNGRSGEGRSGKSSGEFADDAAVGKGGRNTDTRLDPTPFQKGQVNDTSKDPVGGATGGGKVSGQGGQGLEGPVPPQSPHQQMQRLAQRQAEIRNTAERLNLQYKIGRYDNFKLLESIAMMRRVESDLAANRYQNAMYRKDVTVDALDTSRLLLGGQLSIAHDTTPPGNHKLQQEIGDAMKGTLPPAWSGALKEYYRKLGEQ